MTAILCVFVTIVVVAAAKANPPNSGGQMTRELAMASESGSQGASFSNFESFGKGATIYRETVVGDDGVERTVVTKGDNSTCQNYCVEEGFLQPLNAPKIIEVLSKEDGFYASYSTFHGYCKFAELLTGEVSLKSKDDVPKLCLNARHRGDAEEILGFGNSTYKTQCKISKMGISSTCEAGQSSTGKSSKAYPTGFSYVWTDEDSNVLVVACFSDGEKIWLLATCKSKSVSDEVKKTVLDQVKKLGLDTKDAIAYEYSQCKA